MFPGFSTVEKCCFEFRSKIFFSVEITNYEFHTIRAVYAWHKNVVIFFPEFFVDNLSVT